MIIIMKIRLSSQYDHLGDQNNCYGIHNEDYHHTDHIIIIYDHHMMINEGGCQTNAFYENPNLLCPEDRFSCHDGAHHNGHHDGHHDEHHNAHHDDDEHLMLIMMMMSIIMVIRMSIIIFIIT